MATDRFLDSTLAAGNRTSAQAQFAGDLKAGLAVTAKTAADNDGSVLRIANQVPTEMCIRDIAVMNDAIAGLTSVSIGIYTSGVGGAAISSALFASAVDLSAGNPVATPKNMLLAVSIANMGLNIRDLYKAVTGNDLSARFVDIALTLTTAGTNTGNIAVRYAGWVQ